MCPLGQVPHKTGILPSQVMLLASETNFTNTTSWQTLIFKLANLHFKHGFNLVQLTLLNKN